MCYYRMLPPVNFNSNNMKTFDEKLEQILRDVHIERASVKVAKRKILELIKKDN